MALTICYADDGKMYSPQITRRRQRIAIDGVEFWLVKKFRSAQKAI